MPVPTTASERVPTGPSSARPPPGINMNASDIARRMARMETFRQLKPICVSLMAIASQLPTPYSQHAKLIDSLCSKMESMPISSLDPSVINYVLFPVTNIMRQSNPSALPDSFLESAFRLLSYTTDAWRRCEGGMDVVAWEQLWRFCVAAVGPRVGSRDRKDKGKGREVGQEVQLQAVNLLAALLRPQDVNTAGLPHPTPSMLERVATPKSPLLPTLFQTITFLLETAAPFPPYRQLQLSSLRLLRPLITVYLAGKHDVLAAVLPGTVSAMTKLVQTDGKGLKGEVAKECIGLVENVVVAMVNDEDLRDLGLLRPKVDDLSQLAEEWEQLTTASPAEVPPASSTSASSTSPGLANPFPPLTKSYLDFTSTQLLSAIPPILSILSTHQSDLARHAVISLSFSLVQQCSESIPLLRPRCLSTLLLLSQDAFEPVQHDASKRLRALTEDMTLDLDGTMLDLLSNAMNSLPRLVLSQQDLEVDEMARLITAISELVREENLTGQDKGRNPIAHLLGPNGGIERWSWSLLGCLELGRPTGWSASGNTAARSAQIGWEKPSAPSGIPRLIEYSAESAGNEQPSGAFPYLPLRYVESESTSKTLARMLVSLGSSGGEAILFAIDYLIRFAKANKSRQVCKAVSALWVAEQLLDGVASAQVEGTEGRVSKATRKMARQVTKAVVSIDEENDDEDDLDEEDGVKYSGDASAEALIPVERTKGIDTITTLLDRKPISSSFTAAETRRLHNQAQRALFTSLSLETLSLSARILSSSFRPLLLTSLYLLLSHLASPHIIVRDYASIALSQVAYHIGYATPQNMVIDNVDYVINVVSQRLTYRRLSSTAPLVLIAMIRLVGQEIVPLVHDVVDEIFDALDDYHGYETLASSLLAVLVTLIEVMAAEVQAGGTSEDRSRKLQEMRRVDKAPSPAKDLDMLFKWYEERESRTKDQIEEILERAPQHAWGKKDLPVDGEEGEAEDAEPPVASGEDEEPTATRSQIVATRILEKSVYFLTHQSPFLRSKVLSLISHAVPVSAAGNRESDFLPLIDKAWNSILNRLDDKEPYVVTEAAEVIARLCEHAGDFMSKRVLDHAWPRMKILLNAQKELDRKSALARRGTAIGTDSKFTVSHRLHVAVIDVATFIAAEVPVSDTVIWEIILLFRPFLDRRVDEQLQGKARSLYAKLGERDGDAVWMALIATMGQLEGDQGCWEYLNEAGLDIEGNAEAILAEV
ncbi:hypothetical protein I316_02811 [Kwoniella heveanensis BCC8398]|uniref:TEL2-interacting protein 1 n=1 Tax=Kwoniella heveanensis BCC8398 TaxID=1296120 RepID=A0A1B9GWI7_9TREE|nr:hypothetical protein I316_02811 [Kwoniella heveanensis BCC8398]